MFVIGVICVVAKIERAAYRSAGITLAIVMLIPRPKSEWIIAAHLFLEVSIDLAVGLAVAALWPEHKHPKQI